MNTFLTFLGGVITGMLSTSVFFMASLVNQNTDHVDGVVNSLKRAARGVSYEKGGIIYPKSEETIAMEEMFERNDQKGRDTEVGKIEGDEQVS